MAQPAVPVVFIGPMAAGKSTLARALARRTGLQLAPLDAIVWYVYLTQGYSFVEEPPGDAFADKVRHWEPHSIQAVERLLGDFPDAVFDFGAGHAHYEDPARVERLVRALEPVDNVVLVLPCADLDEAEAICNARDQ